MAEPTHPIPLVDHLILLVGGNPLPNAVAGRLLLEAGGQITLLHSKATELVATNLATWLKPPDERGETQGTSTISAIHLKETDEVDRSKIKGAVSAVLEGEAGRVGLHYTGGTKAMAVHAYAAVSKMRPDAVFSYLDSRTLCLACDDGASYYVGRHERINLSIEDLFQLHGITLQHRHDTSHKEVLADKEGDDKGARFEKEVGCALWSLSSKLEITDFWMNVLGEIRELPKDRWPEFDILALRGYQLFFISCTTKDARSELKSKLIEAFVRARQLGGDEACVALACQREDPTLEKELQHALQVQGRVKVFGPNHLSNLAAHLENWIKQQGRHGKRCNE